MLQAGTPFIHSVIPSLAAFTNQEEERSSIHVVAFISQRTLFTSSSYTNRNISILMRQAIVIHRTCFIGPVPTIASKS